MPRTDLAGALEVADRLRRAIGSQTVVAGSSEISVTVSGGCALSMGEQPDTLLQLADSCLYQAKASGRDKIVAGTLPATDLVTQARDSEGSPHKTPVPEVSMSPAVKTEWGYRRDLLPGVAQL